MALSESKKRLEKRLSTLAYIVTAAVLFLVAFMHKVKFDLGMNFKFLPPVIASLNVLTAIILCFALFFIKNKNIDGHQKSIYAAMACSVLFLICYVLYHITTPDTKFGGVGVIRTIYFTILISHIVLAAAILPFILFTFIRAITGQYDRHKKMARWVFPVWLYVAISGPICYLMLKPYYQ